MRTPGPLVGRRWGSLAGGPLRSGGRHYRLVVFPPGTDDRERWLLRGWQWWPFVGALAATLTFAVLDDRLGPAIAPAAALTAYLGPRQLLRIVARRPLRDLCVVHAEDLSGDLTGFLSGPHGARDLARCRSVVALSSRITDAERALDRGELSPVDFQRIWGDVHAQARALAGAGAAA